MYQVAGVVSYHKIDDDYVYSTHVDGVETVLRTAKALGVSKVVVTASTAGIGIPDDKQHPLNEKSPFDFKQYQWVMYMYSKHKTITVCQQFAIQGLNVSIVSPTTIYGPGDVTMHVGGIIKKIKEGKMAYAPPGGNAVVSIDDAVDAHLLVMEKGRSGENYIIADEYITYVDMFAIIADIVGAPRITRTLPQMIRKPMKFFLHVLEEGVLFFGKKSVLSPASLNFSFKYRYFDSSKIRTELGWSPKVHFKDAIRASVAFYTEHKML